MSRNVAFAALRHADYRWYFLPTVLWMMGDYVEHVISYWVLFDKFQSPMLAGYAVISHWAPFLFLSVWAGTLADRFDCRKLVLASQLLFMGVSAAWAVLFLTDTLQLWHAVVLLTLHGFAGVLLGPANQLVLHDIVGRDQLQSAIRTAALGRNLGILLGPAVGGLLLVTLGPATGMFINVLIYLPLALWAVFAPYTGHLRDPEVAQPRHREGIFESLRSIRSEPSSRTILTMVMLSGVTSLLVGNAFQAQMPEFAHDLHSDKAGVGYSLLLAASAAGGLLGGLALESMGWLRPSSRLAVICAALWSVAIGAFAMATDFYVALILLFIAGWLNLAYLAMTQTLVQLNAPPRIRGSMMGLLGVTQSGMKVGSGLTVGGLGVFLGIHASLALSCAILLVLTLALLVWERGHRPIRIEAA